jgi:hypothetical protein
MTKSGWRFGSSGQNEGSMASIWRLFFCLEAIDKNDKSCENGTNGRTRYLEAIPKRRDRGLIKSDATSRSKDDRKSASDGLSNLKTHRKFATMTVSNVDMNETEPLLIRVTVDGHGPTTDIPEVERGVQPPGDFRLFCSLLVDSIPGLSFPQLERYSDLTEDFTVILSYMLQNSIQAVSILIAARLGPNELSAASVALMLAFVTGESLDCFT